MGNVCVTHLYMESFGDPRHLPLFCYRLCIHLKIDLPQKWHKSINGSIRSIHGLLFSGLRSSGTQTHKNYNFASSIIQIWLSCIPFDDKPK